MGLLDSMQAGVNLANSFKYSGPSAQEDLNRQRYQNQMLADHLQTYPDLLKAQLQLAQAQGGIAGAQAQYAPQMAAEDYRKSQMINDWYPDLAKAGLASTNATTAHTNLENKYMPFEELVKAQTANNKADRFGGAYQLAKALSSMPPAQRDLWISQNQGEYNDMLTNLGNKATQNTSYITDNVISNTFPQFTKHLPVSNAERQNLQDKVGDMPLTINPQQIKPLFSPSTNEQTADLKNAAEIAANKSATTAATQRQVEGAIQVSGIMNDSGFQQQAINAAQYAGALGKGKAAIDALSQSNPQAYEDYLTFTKQSMILLKNRIKTLDQMGATDKQREELDGLFQKTADSLTSNPEQFITQLNNLGTSLSNVAQSVQKSATPIVKNNRLESYKSINNPYENKKMAIIQTPDGRTANIPLVNLEKALSLGAKRVG